MTDTFCHVSTVEVSGESHSFTLPMHRAVAMVQLHLTDEGKLFGDGEWTATQSDFSFVVNADWDGEVVVGF